MSIELIIQILMHQTSIPFEILKYGGALGGTYCLILVHFTGWTLLCENVHYVLFNCSNFAVTQSGVSACDSVRGQWEEWWQGEHSGHSVEREKISKDYIDYND